jgi:hypothetical protein
MRRQHPDVQPYFVLDANVCALLATKDHVNLFLYDPIAPDPQRLIKQGNGNTTARASEWRKLRQAAP